VSIRFDTYSCNVGSAGMKRKGRKHLPKLHGYVGDPPQDGVSPWGPAGRLAFGWRMTRAANWGKPKQQRAYLVLLLAPLTVAIVIIAVALVLTNL